MNEVFRKRLCGDYLRDFMKMVGRARDAMAGRSVVEWAKELGIPPYFPSPHAEAEEPSHEVFVHFLLEDMKKFQCNPERLRDDHRLSKKDWEDAFRCADDVLGMSGLEFVEGRGLKEVRDHVACIHTSRVSARASQQIPAGSYNTTRPGNRSWWS
tara:strand:+ start:255 stop:719 length:465 start_codon:yes stop_codon:yes gene_type:complete